MPLDLTPFGFTPTETAVYEALVVLGPASGYAVAKHLSIARANAYQALNGLVAKGGAVLVDEQPRRYRGVQPRALLALVTQREASKLDLLERQVSAADTAGAATLVPLGSQRGILEVATRAVVRSDEPVRAVAPLDVLQALLPAWRKREADGLESALWVIGAGELEFPVPLRGAVAPLALGAAPGASSLLVEGGRAGICAFLGDSPTGYWTSEPLLVRLIQTAIDHLTG